MSIDGFLSPRSLHIMVLCAVMASPIQPRSEPFHGRHSRRIWCFVETFCLRSERAPPPTNSPRILPVAFRLSSSHFPFLRSMFLPWAQEWRPITTRNVSIFRLNFGSIQCACCLFRSLALGNCGSWDQSFLRALLKIGGKCDCKK